MAATYKDAGVDLDIYAESMRKLPRLMRRTFTPRVIPNEGGFAGLFSLDFADKLFARRYDNPVLVSGTDGVGTKLKIAQQTARHDTVGIDLVAMCVNDLLCTGAEPLFFLDYVAMSHDDPVRLEQIVRGISDGCVESGMALLGGETAIMPDMYAGDDYDLAGFAVGVVERDALIDGSRISPGDVLIGLSSSGFHSNGFSLVRKVIADAGLDWDHVPEGMGGKTLGELCLVPTLIYSAAVKAIQTACPDGGVRGLAHITGGGIEENLDRILPATVDAEVRREAWKLPDVFAWLMQAGGGIEDAEMRRVFNMGIGMIAVVAPDQHEAAAAAIRATGISASAIGRITEGGSGTVKYV